MEEFQTFDEVIVQLYAP